jgi:hypothetical protein
MAAVCRLLQIRDAMLSVVRMKFVFVPADYYMNIIVIIGTIIIGCCA